MALTIKDSDLLGKIDDLSRLRRVSKVAVLRSALEREYDAETAKRSARDILAPVLAKAASMGHDSAMSVADHKRTSDEDWGE